MKLQNELASTEDSIKAFTCYLSDHARLRVWGCLEQHVFRLQAA